MPQELAEHSALKGGRVGRDAEGDSPWPTKPAPEECRSALSVPRGQLTRTAFQNATRGVGEEAGVKRQGVICLTPL